MEEKEKVEKQRQKRHFWGENILFLEKAEDRKTECLTT